MDSSDEWEEEEQCLLVDLHGILEPDFLQKAEGNCKVLGIGTENPYLQVDGYTFSGKYVAPIGSYLIFEEKNPSGETETNPETDCAKLEYVACLDKKLDVNRTFVSPKVSKDANSADKSSGSVAPANQQGSQEYQNQDSSETPAGSDGPVAMETSSEVT